MVVTVHDFQIVEYIFYVMLYQLEDFVSQSLVFFKAFYLICS